MPIDGGFILIIMMSDFWKKHLPFIMQIFQEVVVGSYEDHLGEHLKDIHTQTPTQSLWIIIWWWEWGRIHVYLNIFLLVVVTVHSKQPQCI